jgi:hypothetical protein
MDYHSLIQICQKYNIEYRNHYGRSKSYIKLKRKVQQYENNKNKNEIKETHTHPNCLYFRLDTEDELSNNIKRYLNCYGMDFDF